MMTLSRTNKILLAVFVAAAVAGGYWFLVLSPQRAKAAQLQTDISAKQSALAQIQQQMAGYEKAKANYKANYARFAKLGKAVPGDDDVRSLLVQLDLASEQSHVAFNTLEVGTGLAGATAAPTTTPTPSTTELAKAPGLVPIGSSGVSALPFTLSFDGSFAGLTSFFNRLEHFVSVRNQKISATGRLLRIETLNLTAGAAGWPSMKAQVGAASYVIDPIDAPGTGAAGAAATAGSTTTPASTTPGTTPATTTATATGVGR
jgi:hypothetical protein